MGKPLLVVGLGASAGGLEALERFFERMPAETGMAFVVVQHLSPDFKSLMDDILSRRTPIPVRVVEDGIAVEPDTIYLNPPKKQMIFSGGKLLLADKDASEVVSYPIDHFLRSLANDAAARCAAVIFSGTGSDGSRGVRDVQRAGGLVIAQDPETAGFDGMPRSAIDTGAVDLTMAPEHMADALVSFAGDEGGGTDVLVSPKRGLSALFALLRDAYGIDFASYKLPTIARRTERRIRAAGAPDLERYVERLAHDEAELDELYRDLLIGVTRFFRDKEAFERLEADVLPALIERLGRDEELRVWAAGCATGEEAYSLAIAIRERLDALGMSNPVKIFATDVHRQALKFAAAGCYDEASLADVSAERKDRFFVGHHGGTYQLVPAIRSMVVFAPQNVLRDVPFTKLHLVSCRNLLIYLQPAAQRKVLSLFHFGLKTGGVLFLGSSESLVDLADEFDVVDAHWKIFKKRRDVRIPAEFRGAAATGLRARSDLAVPIAPARVGDLGAFGIYDVLLDEFMPPSMLVGLRRDLVHTFGGASRYLRVPEGRATTDAVDMLRDDLRVAVTGALQRVFGDHRTVSYRGLRVERAEGDALVDLTVREVRNRRTGDSYALVTFEERGAAPAVAEAPIPLELASREQIQALEMELRHTKENLQTTIEELETSNEELQATNEELTSSNEELQTTNEELHSVNQELFTVNGEFQKKIRELTELTGDMDHLLASTDVHTLFLDQDLRVRKFTPTIADTFSLLPSDVGRRIDSFTHTLLHPSLVEEVRKVAASGVAFEDQIADSRGRWFLVRVLPYRRGGTPDGAVVTLIDISRMKRFEMQARSKDEQLSSILRNSPHPVFVRDLGGRFVLADESFRRLANVDPVGRTAGEIFPPEVAAVLVRDDTRILERGESVESEETIPTERGARTFLTVKFPMRDATGQVVGVGGIKTDVTSLKRAEADARDAVTRRDRFLAMLSHELRNPLAAILNASRIVMRAAPGEDVRHWEEIVAERSEHMAHLLDDLLDVARLTQDKLVLKREVVDLRSTAAGVLAEVASRFEERHVELVSEIGDEPIAVLGDTTRLQQVQVNLLTNAARYTPAGGRATYRLRREGADAEISVADDGEGIAPDMLGRIFELFVQADEPGTRGADSGLGVGLALVRRIVQLHGGEVTVASGGAGKGAEFRVRIPMVEQTADVPAQPPRILAPASLHVLLVDDDEQNRKVMRRLLEMDGARVDVAADGDRALTRLASGDAPDLVLLDIGLPGLDGYEVCRRVRALGDARLGALVVIALTGFGQESDRENAAKAGFDGHLTKPVDVDDIYRLYAEAARTRATAAAL